MRGACGVCGGGGGDGDRALRRRDLAPLCALRPPDSSHYAWICQFCWRRATQCIKFIERVHNSQINFNLLDVEPPRIRTRNTTCSQETNIHGLSTVSLGPFSICSYKVCNKRCNFKKVIHQKQPNHKEISFQKVQVKRETKVFKTEHHNIKIEYDEKDIRIPDDEGIINERIEYKEKNEILLDNKEIEFEYEQKQEMSTDNKEYEIETIQETADVKKGKRKVGKLEKTTNQDSAVPVKRSRTDLLKMVKNKCVKIDYTKEEQLKEIELRKQCNKYLNSIYKCEKCGLYTNELDIHEEHNKLRHDESAGLLECEICHYRFACIRVLNDHLSKHSRRWRCVTCSAVLKGLKDCLRHIDMCLNSDGFPCEVCNKIYRSHEDMQRHKFRSHYLEKRYMCDECNKLFKYKCVLRKHILSVHHGWGAFTCNVCGKKSNSFYVHNHHMKTHGPREPPAERVYCVECDKYFKDQTTFNQHIKQSLKHVTKDTYKQVCGECGQRFPSPFELKIHTRKVHTKERTYHCTLCDKSYFTNGDLNKHNKTKHMERRRDHVCSACGKAFYRTIQLKSHVVAIHNKERPFACELCPATFGFRASLYTHGRLKHGRKKKTDI